MKINIRKSMTLKLFTVWAIICSCSVFAFSADNNQEEAVTTENVNDLSELDIRMEKKVSVDFDNIPLDTAVRQLAEQVSVDFVISPKVQGEITVTLTDVSVKEALQCILDVHGCGFIKGENVVRILPRDEMPEISERLVTQTFEIIYADVEQVVTALDKFKSPEGSVSYIQGTSHVIVTDTETKVRDIAVLIQTIDKIIPQVLVEVRIYDITNKNNLDLGVDWYAGKRTNWNATGYAVNDDIVVDKSGVDTYVSSKTEPSFMTGFSGPVNKTAAETMGYMRFGVLNDYVDIDAQIRAEKENIEAKLLANPRILVIDNGTALFDIVTEHPYIERTITGSTVTETVKFKNVGTKLLVTPHVTRDGMLRLRIQPEFGILISQVTLASSNVPVVDTRKVQTEALIRSGETVVLGGMRKKDTAKQINKVPLLGDLPLLGQLFRFEGEATTVGEIVVFITPHIVTEPSMTTQEQQAYEVTDFPAPQPSVTKAETAANNQDQ